jgi:hypothetical protein
MPQTVENQQQNGAKGLPPADSHIPGFFDFSIFDAHQPEVFMISRSSQARQVWNYNRKAGLIKDWKRDKPEAGADVLPRGVNRKISGAF